MNTTPDETVAQAVIAADARRRSACVAGDVDTLTDVLAPDFYYVHNVGFGEGRDAYLAHFREGRIDIRGLECLSAKVRIIADGVALLEGESTMTYRMPPSAPTTSFVSLFLGVWATSGDGVWRLRAYHSTLRGMGLDPPT